MTLLVFGVILRRNDRDGLFELQCCYHVDVDIVGDDHVVVVCGGFDGDGFVFYKVIVHVKIVVDDEAGFFGGRIDNCK